MSLLCWLPRIFHRYSLIDRSPQLPPGLFLSSKIRYWRSLLNKTFSFVQTLGLIINSYCIGSPQALLPAEKPGVCLTGKLHCKRRLAVFYTSPSLCPLLFSHGRFAKYLRSREFPSAGSAPAFKRGFSESTLFFISLSSTFSCFSGNIFPAKNFRFLPKQPFPRSLEVFELTFL